MPVNQSRLTNQDPIVMNKKKCEERIIKFLTEHGFELVSHGTRNEPDIVASKLGWRIAVEVRGNQAISHDAKTVFDTTQLNVHFAEQIYDVMRAYNGTGSRTLHVIANPDIPRIRTIDANVSKALNDFNVVRFWLSDSGIDFTIPLEVKMLANELLY